MATSFDSKQVKGEVAEQDQQKGGTNDGIFRALGDNYFP